MSSKQTEGFPTEEPTAVPVIRHRVPVFWDALEDAFENNSPEVRSYLHLETGEVVRLVDGVADPTLLGRIMSDTLYLRIDPVSSREQYRWMERFIATVEEGELREILQRSIDGKGAFRRFKDGLMLFPADRERWFTFRSDRVKAAIESWLAAHGVEALPRPEWPVPSKEEDVVAARGSESDSPSARAADAAAAPIRPMAAVADTRQQNRQRLSDLSAGLPARDIDTLVAMAEFFADRLALQRERIYDKRALWSSVPSSAPKSPSGRASESLAAAAPGDDDVDRLDPDDDW